MISLMIGTSVMKELIRETNKLISKEVEAYSGATDVFLGLVKHQ